MSDQYLSELNERVHRLEEQRPVISDLKSKVARLERTIEQVHNLEMAMAKARELEAGHTAGHDGEHHIPPEIGEIIKNLDNPLEGVRRTFSCARCRTKNRVAVYVKCTACDTHTWLGWWPERRPRAPAPATAPAPAANGVPHGGTAPAPSPKAPEAVRALRADL
ncbi:MAG: hypothetical protein HYY34_04995 [Chloroflexi bacterium]|nr:hypothetical protein [Chloroflexota bacterium]